MRQTGVAAAVTFLLLVGVAVVFVMNRPDADTARRELLRFNELSDRRDNAEMHDRDPKYKGAPARPLNREETAELEVLRHRVGKWRADHPNSP